MCVKIKGNIYKSRVNQLTSQIISDWKKMFINPNSSNQLRPDNRNPENKGKLDIYIWLWC